MRMDFLSWGAFWGIVLVLLGISMIIKAIFGIDIPIFKVVMAVLLILFGVQMLTGIKIFNHRGKADVIFTESNIKSDNENNKYSVVFGSGIVDMRETLLDKTVSKEVSVAFGSSVIKISPDMPVIIKGSCAFASIMFPDGNQISFGDYVYKTKSYTQGGSNLEIEVSAAFGSIKVVAE